MANVARGRWQKQRDAPSQFKNGVPSASRGLKGNGSHLGASGQFAACSMYLAGSNLA